MTILKVPSVIIADKRWLSTRGNADDVHFEVIRRLKFLELQQQLKSRCIMPLSTAPLVLIAALAGEIKMLVDERQQEDSVFQLPIRKKKIYQEKKSSQKRNSCQEWQASSCLCFFPHDPHDHGSISVEVEEICREF